MVVGSIAMLFPLWWMLALSLETEQRAGAALASGSPFGAFPTDPQFGNYAQAMKEVGTVPWQGFLDALANSIVVTVLVVAGTILSSSLVGTSPKQAITNSANSIPRFLQKIGAQSTVAPSKRFSKIISKIA